MKYLKENRFIAVLLIVFLLGTLGYGIYELVYHISNAKQQESYEQIWANAKVVVLTETDAVEESAEVSPTEEFLAQGNHRELYGEYLTGSTVDFEVLRQYNEDVIGYILIPGTKVSYPILQSQDNEYYLNHSIDGSKGYPGSIYAENFNAATLDDPLTILYGHNMRNRTMFGELDLYAKEEFRQEHPYIIVYLPEEVRVYEVVVATKYTDEHLLSDRFEQVEDGTYLFQGFAGGEGVQFIEDMAEYQARNAFIDVDKLEEEEQILALSTCIGSNMRYIVGARRIL